jgi:hypothetical protein
VRCMAVAGEDPPKRAHACVKQRNAMQHSPFDRRQSWRHILPRTTSPVPPLARAGPSSACTMRMP